MVIQMMFILYIDSLECVVPCLLLKKLCALILIEKLWGLSSICLYSAHKAYIRNIMGTKSSVIIIALRHTRKLKLASQGREKCSTLLNQVEEVIRVIADAESSKEVSEAMKIGARTIKENRMSVEEVQLCLQELDESIESQKEVDKVLESTSYADIEDEDIEDEFRKLELEVGGASSQVSMSTVGMEHSAGVTESSETADLLSNALSNLKLIDAAGKESVVMDSKKTTRNMSKDPRLEAA